MFYVALITVLSLSTDAVETLEPTPGALQLYFYPAGTAAAPARDGSELKKWEGPGRTQMRLARRYLSKRDELIVEAEKPLKSLMDLITRARDVTDEKVKKDLRTQISEAAAGALDQSEKDTLESLKMEAQRLKLMGKAVAIAEQNDAPLPDVDGALIAGLSAKMRSGESEKRVRARFAAYRGIANALVAYLDGDIIDAIELLRQAEKSASDLEAVHVYLGSFYYLARQPSKAVEHWKKALAINPENTELQEAIAAFTSND